MYIYIYIMIPEAYFTIRTRNCKLTLLGHNNEMWNKTNSKCTEASTPGL